jgi:hypothetical protein
VGAADAAGVAGAGLETLTDGLAPELAQALTTTAVAARSASNRLVETRI